LFRVAQINVITPADDCTNIEQSGVGPNRIAPHLHATKTTSAVSDHISAKADHAR